MRHIIFATVLAAAFAVVPVSANTEGGKSTPTASTDPDQKIKCRKVEVSGSLIKKGRVCRTVAEWKTIQNNGNRTARAIVESGGICAGQCGGN